MHVRAGPERSPRTAAERLVKMVIDAKTERILGVHILASLDADMIHEGVLAVKYRMTIDDIIDT